MGLDVWFYSDVLRILAAVIATNRASLEIEPFNIKEAEVYQQGFEAAVRCIAAGFGIVLEGVMDGKVQDL